MKKAVSYPIHKMGKTCGYEEFEDGSIKIAPVWANRFDQLIARRASVGELLQMIVEHCNELMIPIKQAESSVWTEMENEYGLDRNKYTYQYSQNQGLITRKLTEPEVKP